MSDTESRRSKRHSTSSSSSDTRNRTWLGMGLLLLAAAGFAVWFFWPRGEDPEVARVRGLMEERFNANSPPNDAERQQLRQEKRTAMESLNDAQRSQLREAMGQNFRRRMETTINQYFELPKNQRVAYLDQQIDRMDQARGMFGQGGGGPPGLGGGPGGPGGPGGDAGGVSRRRRMLDRTTPEQRVKFSEYMEALQKRRTQLGK